jgi:glycosyltransferase involved in cell wall biosynthesis
MKIVHVNDMVYGYASGDFSAKGGAERYQWLLARALADAGWDVTVGVHRALELGKQTIIGRVKFIGIGKSSASKALSSWHRFLLSERPDWWFWQCADHWLGPAFAVAKSAGVKTIFSAMHDRDVQIRHALFRRSRFWPLYALGLLLSDKIFVQHGEQLRQLPRCWRAKASVLPGIVSKRPTVKPHSARKRYVAWVGVLREPKRPDLLVEIARRAPELRFIVCGGTSNHRSAPGYSETIIQSLKNLPNVEYLGHVAPDNTLDVIAEAATLLSTSDEEGYPSVFLEAWSSGTPVVSLKIDPDDVIKQKHLGRVSGNIERAVTDIRALMASSKERQEIAARALQQVSESHSAEAVITAFEDALQRAEFSNIRRSLCAP